MKKLICPTLLALSATAALAADKRPNIILFLVDDMGVMDTSLPFITNSDGEAVTYPNNEWYRTPNMERLAEQGVRFSTFYAQSVSSPTRVSIMTGQNSTRTGVTNWINDLTNNRTEYGPEGWNWDGISPDNEATMPRMLQESGYRTIHVGKAHFGNDERAYPEHIGFDVNIAGSAIGQPGSYLGTSGFGHIAGNKKRAVPGLEKYHGQDIFLTEVLTIEANKQIDKAIDDKEPFFLYMSQYAVHAPFEADKRFVDNYDGEGKHPQAVAFATLIEGMDKSLGDIMDHVIERGIAENTLIIFLGDNGSDAPTTMEKGYDSSAPLRSKKGSEYEGGVRVPFIAAWAQPNEKNKNQQKLPIAQNVIQCQLGTIMDLYPTILGVAGVKEPSGVTLDGYKLNKLFTGEADEAHPNRVLMHFPHDHRGKYFTTYRDENYKLIYYYNPAEPRLPLCELYNLEKDPFETVNLAAIENEKLAEMVDLMSKQLEAEGALYPQDKDGNPVKPISLIK